MLHSAEENWVWAMSCWACCERHKASVLQGPGCSGWRWRGMMCPYLGLTQSTPELLLSCAQTCSSPLISISAFGATLPLVFHSDNKNCTHLAGCWPHDSKEHRPWADTRKDDSDNRVYWGKCTQLCLQARGVREEGPRSGHQAACISCTDSNHLIEAALSSRLRGSIEVEAEDCCDQLVMSATGSS